MRISGLLVAGAPGMLIAQEKNFIKRAILMANQGLVLYAVCAMPLHP